MEETIKELAESSGAAGNPKIELEEGVVQSELEVGQRIRVNVDGEWKEATVLSAGQTIEEVPAEGPKDKPVLADPSVANVSNAPQQQPEGQADGERAKDYLLELYQAGKPLTEKQMRTLRGRYYTVKHIPLDGCEHKLDMINEPKNNCPNCWFMWYNTHGQLCQTMDEAYHQKGLDFLISMRGKKAVKMFLKFMATLAQWQTQMAAMQAQTQTPTGGENGSERSGSETPGA